MVRLQYIKRLQVCLISILFLCAGALWYLCNGAVVDLTVLEQYDVGRPTVLLDDQGKEWARFAKDKRQPIAYAAMPTQLIQAFIAVEDWHFFRHKGLSFRGIARSFFVNVYYGKRMQGASTISQQLVKMLFLDGKKTIRRKLKEQWYALLIEQQFTKEQILETYLNHVYFGAGVYGVQAAAQRFFGVSVEKLSLDQCAVLAGVIRSPGHYSPFLYPLSCKDRRAVVLNQMVKCGFISFAECCDAKAKELGICKNTQEEIIAPHAKETIRVFLENTFGRNVLYTQGLVVQTTLNTALQKKAQNSFDEQMVVLQKQVGEDIQGGLVSLDVATGAIKALVGGYDFKKSSLNRVTQAMRQQGSVFKPLLYAVALQKGFSFLDRAVDEPITITFGSQVWEPRNYNRAYDGMMTLARALSYSNNIISAKIMMEVGAESVVALAKKCYLSSPIEPYPSLALGCVDSNVLEVAGMFSLFANDGFYVRPHLIEWVKDRWGKKIYGTYVAKESVIESHIAHQVARVLSFGIERRKKRGLVSLDSEAIGKTGTTNDSRTCWFVGSTPEITTAVYVGFDDNRLMGKDVFPLTTAYPIWLSLHQKIETVKKKFVYDPSLREVSVNIKTGELCDDKQNSEVFTLLV